MNKPLPPLGSEPELVSARLRALPKALGYPNQSAFAKAMGVKVSRFNMAVLTGNLGKDLAFQIRSRVDGMRIEWLWFGEAGMMPPILMRKIEAAMAQQSLEDTLRNGARRKS